MDGSVVLGVTTLDSPWKCPEPSPSISHAP